MTASKKIKIGIIGVISASGWLFVKETFLFPGVGRILVSLLFEVVTPDSSVL